MANTLQRTVNLSQLFIKGLPLTGVQGAQNEPAFSIGDWVRGFMLAPPFAWRWNRATTTISLVQGTQDYEKTLTDFGWLERATISNATNYYELEVVLDSSEENQQDQPRQISARLDDGAGIITFRVFPVPDAAYTAHLTYQKASPTFAAIDDTWSPIPDYMSHIVNTGFLAKAYEYAGDERGPFTMQMFLKQLTAASSGLDETQVDIFLDEKLRALRNQSAAASKVQLGVTGRGGL